MTLSKMDYWRLSDELSVIDAAILITGNDPSNKDRIDDGHNFEWIQSTDYDGYDAAFKSIRNAILSNRLKARLSFAARDPVFEEIPPSTYADRTWGDSGAAEDEIHVKFDTLIRARGYDSGIFSNRKLNDLNAATEVYVINEPNWVETTIDVEDLKKWLSSKGLAPQFFFPDGKPEGFRDSSHPRYSAKLACAVAAWEAVRHAQPNKSVKQSIRNWITNNAVRFGMEGKDGTVPDQAIGDVARVVNWDTKGGATKTPSASDDTEADADAIQNFEENIVEEIPF